MVATLLPIAFLANSATSRMVRSLFDDTFSGVHQLSWFDWAILIPYFGILAILSIYGFTATKSFTRTLSIGRKPRAIRRGSSHNCRPLRYNYRFLMNAM